MNNLLNEVLYKIDIDRDDSDTIHFYTLSGKEFIMYHDQDCCESVVIEDINGNIDHLIGSPILRADEKTSNTPSGSEGYTPESCTYTFYTLATLKGYVDIRWFGESNGYYSEDVSISQYDHEVPEDVRDQYLQKFPEFFI